MFQIYRTQYLIAQDGLLEEEVIEESGEPYIAHLAEEFRATNQEYATILGEEIAEKKEQKFIEAICIRETFAQSHEDEPPEPIDEPPAPIEGEEGAEGLEEESSYAEEGEEEKGLGENLNHSVEGGRYKVVYWPDAQSIAAGVATVGSTFSDYAQAEGAAKGLRGQYAALEVIDSESDETVWSEGENAPERKESRKPTYARKDDNTNRMKMISTRAKEIYKPKKMKWTDAIKKASKELKKEGKL